MSVQSHTSASAARGMFGPVLADVGCNLPVSSQHQGKCRVDIYTFAVADRFRKSAISLILISSIIAVVLAVATKVRVDPAGTALLGLLIGSLLFASRAWWGRDDQQRIADACGTVAVVALAGMSCGAVAMLELLLHFPLADGPLRAADLALGLDGIRIIEILLRQGHWIFWLMAPAYNLTIPIFFGGLVALSWRGDRIEAWRAALCFTGTLLTTCLIAAFAPAKGLGSWASPQLLSRLPQEAMRTFWAHFDSFYSGSNPVLRLQVVDGVVSFPSFHAVVGFLTLAMWRNYRKTRAIVAVWLIIMLLATLPGGGHYVVDLIGGFAVWALWFISSRIVEQRVSRAIPGAAPVRA